MALGIMKAYGGNHLHMHAVSSLLRLFCEKNFETLGFGASESESI